MKIYNRGGRTITTKFGSVAPSKWLECPADDGAKLIKMFPRDFVADSAKDSGFTAEIETLRKENARLAQENAELRALIAPAAELGDETPEPDKETEATAEDIAEDDTQNDEAEETAAADESDIAGQAENADKPKKAKKAKKR